MDDLLRALTERPVPWHAVDRLRAARHDSCRLLRLAYEMVQAALPHAGSFLGAVYSWLPDHALGELASAAIIDSISFGAVTVFRWNPFPTSTSGS